MITMPRTHQREVPAGWLTITQAARLLGRTYQVTRDLMLSGKCGPTRLLNGRTLIAQESSVLAYKKTQHAAAVEQKGK